MVGEGFDALIRAPGNSEEPLVALMALVPALHVSIKPQGWDK